MSGVLHIANATRYARGIRNMFDAGVSTMCAQRREKIRCKQGVIEIKLRSIYTSKINDGMLEISENQILTNLTNHVGSSKGTLSESV